MNVWLAGNTPAIPEPYGKYRSRIILRASQIRAPAPSNCFVFQDSREDGFYASHFITACTGLDSIVTFPGSYHNRAGNFSFADGHTEVRKWRDVRTCPPLQDHWLLPFPSPASYFGISSPNNSDVRWLQEHAFPSSE